MHSVFSRRIKEFQGNVLAWYADNGRSFPWRNKKLTSYQLIIAETLLQRTRAETVSCYYKSFFTSFPGWASLANANVRKIENTIKPLGLYRQRAKRLKLLAVEMVRRNGRLPRDRHELEGIPFLGQYIANAIELIIFNKCRPLIDVNMARLLERYFGQREKADIRYDPYLQKLAYEVVCHRRAKEINWAILDFASAICKARNPLHDRCPIRMKCRFYKQAGIVSSCKS